MTRQITEGTPQGLQLARDGAGNTAISFADVGKAGQEARQVALVQAAFAIANKFPRNLDSVRLKLLAECRRPGFADSARYRRDQGMRFDEEKETWVPNVVEGWSIRFVEAAVRCMGNILPEAEIVHEDEEKVVLRCVAIDLEANVQWATSTACEKFIERKKLAKGQVAVRQRVNRQGKVLFLLPATEDDMRLKINRAVSMALRTNALRFIPGDLLDEALATIREVQRAEIKKDPTKARKDLVDKFALLGVQPKDLSDYFGGRPLDTLSAEEIIELKAIGVLIREQGVRWREVLATSPSYTMGEEAAADSETKAEADAQATALRERIDAMKQEGIARKAEGTKKPSREEPVKQEAQGTPAESPGRQAGPPSPRAAKRAEGPTKRRLQDIAEAEGVTEETVMTVQRLMHGGDNEETIARAATAEGFACDAVQVAAIIDALRKSATKG